MDKYIYGNSDDDDEELKNLLNHNDKELKSI